MASYKEKIARLNALLDAQKEVLEVQAEELQRLQVNAEIIHDAHRYLALRRHGILLRQGAVVFDVVDIDAAADSLLDGSAS